MFNITDGMRDESSRKCVPNHGSVQKSAQKCYPIAKPPIEMGFV